MSSDSLIFHKKIKLREQNLEEAKKIETEHKTSPVLSRILSARGFVAGEELTKYLKPTLSSGLDDIENLKNLKEACLLIKEHYNKKNLIAVCSDFDVDGLTSASQVIAFFKELNIKHKFYVPNRFSEGYGLNENMIKQAAKDGAKLLIALDYGTSNSKELTLTKELRMQSIVIDHHHVNKDNLPTCDVFINPQQDGCNFANGTLCTAGLVWYLLIQLKKEILEAKNIDIRDYLDLASLGTICDMVPLVGTNRVIAEKGLEVLTNSKRVGIKALKNISGINGAVKSYNVGFGFGPRINAAGRMERGDVVIDLLTSQDSIETKKIATQLNKLNSLRQDIELRMKNKAINKINSLKALPSGLVVWDDDFHTGVIGIVAQRLVETFYRPSIVMGKDQDNYKGSVRGISNFSVVEALTKLSDCFIKFGGHSGAGGFTLKNIDLEEFSDRFNKACEEMITPEDFVPYSLADTVVSFNELDDILCDELKVISPYGVKNPAPQLMVNNIFVKEVKLLKNTHLKATLTDGKRYLDALMWNTVRHPCLYQGANINIVCKAEVNSFNNNLSVQLILQAVEEDKS